MRSRLGGRSGANLTSGCPSSVRLAPHTMRQMGGGNGSSAVAVVTVTTVPWDRPSGSTSTLAHTSAHHAHVCAHTGAHQHMYTQHHSRIDGFLTQSFPRPLTCNVLSPGRPRASRME